MIWPKSYALTAKLYIGVDETCLELPGISDKERNHSEFKEPELGCWVSPMKEDL